MWPFTNNPISEINKKRNSHLVSPSISAARRMPMPTIEEHNGSLLVEMVRDYMKYAERYEYSAAELMLQLISDKALKIKEASVNKEQNSRAMQDKIKEALIKGDKIVRPERVMAPINISLEKRGLI